MSKKDEALINEFKGNLFEYLMASKIANENKLEKTFYQSVDKVYLKRLTEYQSWLIDNRQDLLAKLQNLAEHTVESLNEHLPKKINQVQLIGKSSTHKLKKYLKECDVLLTTNEGDIPISIKLTKANAFVNTKSGGVKSFIESYFKQFKSSKKDQVEINSFLDKSFLEMAHNLHLIGGINFNGKFEDLWEEKFSTLPGELPSEMKESLYKHYSKIISKMHEKLVDYSKQDFELFKESLLPIVGFGTSNMIQVNCFYKGSDYRFEKNVITDMNDIIQNMERLAVSSYEFGKSSFIIEMGKRVLQIRVKPMNKFTVPALKINCSVKLIK